MAIILLTYGIALAGLSVLAKESIPAFPNVVFIAGTVGGVLSVLLGGINAFVRKTRRTWAIVTVIVVALALLAQVVPALFEASANLPRLLVLGFMFLFTVGILLYLFHGERPPEFYDSKAAGR